MFLRTLACLLTLALGLLVVPGTAELQPLATIPRIGVLRNSPMPRRQAGSDALRQTLHELGYVEGQHIAFEWRFADTLAQIPDLVAELVRLKVDILVVQSTSMAQAAKQATSTIPIVLYTANDPVGTGLVASLARPGGNVTGLTSIASEVSTKALALLQEALPGITRVAVFQCPAGPHRQREWAELQSTAQRLGLHLHALKVQRADPAHIAALFAEAVRERADAFLALDCTHLVMLPREQMAALALQHRLPGMHPWRSAVLAGGLMSYGQNSADRWRHAARYVDKLLKGATPADLPVEQPMHFELFINLKTAAALGITIPPTLLFQADKVIQ